MPICQILHHSQLCGKFLVLLLVSMDLRHIVDADGHWLGIPAQLSKLMLWHQTLQMLVFWLSSDPAFIWATMTFITLHHISMEFILGEFPGHSRTLAGDFLIQPQHHSFWLVKTNRNRLGVWTYQAVIAQSQVQLTRELSESRSRTRW